MVTKFKTNRIFILLSFLTISLTTISIFTFLQLKNTRSQLKSEIFTKEQLKNQLNEYRYYRLDESNINPSPSKLDKIGRTSLNHFISDIYPQFSEFNKIVSVGNINRVFKFPLKENNSLNGVGGNLVEVKKTIDSEMVKKCAKEIEGVFDEHC